MIVIKKNLCEGNIQHTKRGFKRAITFQSFSSNSYGSFLFFKLYFYFFANKKSILYSFNEVNIRTHFQIFI